MAAGLGFKDFVTGEVLTAADVDGYLMQGIWVFASAAARSAAVTSPQEGNYSFLKDTNSTEYYDGSAWVAAGGGGGGKVLQVVTASTTTATTVASTSYTDTTLTATITPTSATSTILVLVSQYSFQSRINASINAAIRILRGATAVFNDAKDSSRLTVVGMASPELYLGLYTNLTYRDSPATTSATTYKTQGKVSTTADSAQVVYQDNSTPSTITLLEIGA